MNSLTESWQRFETYSTYRKSILVFFIALLVRISLIFILRPYHDLARFELEKTALSVASSGVYGNPYAIPTGPTAHVSPGYTLILAALFHLFGTGIPAEILKEILASVVSAAACALTLPAALALSLQANTGLFAGLICALLPVKPLVQIDGDWEAPYTALFLLVLAIAVMNQWKRRDASSATALRLGLLWGVALLFSSVLLPVFVLVLLSGVWLFEGYSLPKYRAALATQMVVVLLCLLPWVIRNEIALGAPIATRSNFGIELRVSNNDEATPDQRVNYNRGVYDHFHPLQNVAEAARVRRLGEVSYNQIVLKQTEDWISSHPGRFLALCTGRFWCFWFYPDPSKLKAFFGDVTAVLGIFGFAWAYKNDRIAGVFIAILLLLYPAPNYLIHVGARQRYPIDWLLTLLSVYAIQKIWPLLRARGV